MKTTFLKPTSDVAERQLSVAGFTYNKLRQNLLSTNLEMQLFLNFNRDFWDIDVLSALVNEKQSC